MKTVVVNMLTGPDAGGKICAWAEDLSEMEDEMSL